MEGKQKYKTLTSTSTLAKKCYSAGITTKGLDMFLKPSQGFNLVPNPIVAYTAFAKLLVVFFDFFAGKETVNTDPIRDSDNDGRDAKFL